MNRIILWNEWIGMIKPHYYKGERGSKPNDPETMLRIYLSWRCADRQTKYKDFSISRSITPFLEFMKRRGAGRPEFQKIAAALVYAFGGR